MNSYSYEPWYRPATLADRVHRDQPPVEEP
jgi:hypothetical protein